MALHIVYIGLYVPADIISMDFNFWCKEDALGNVDNWEEKEFEIKKDNNISKDITLTCYPDNPLILHKKDYEINEDTKITNIDDTEEVQDESKNKYYKIELKDNPTILYIPVKDADNYRKNALDWDKFFNICKTDADKDIYCNLEDIKDSLKLTDAEKKGLGNLSCIKMQDLLAKDTDAKKTIAEKLRRLKVTHIHELDSKAYDGIEDDIDKKYLQGCCEKIGVWEKLKSADGFSGSKFKNVKCKDNLLSFVHPAYFLNHLEESDILNIHAKELLSIQKAVLNLKCLERGGVGPRGDNTDADQTWCNIAVYLTIRALDKNYADFLINKGESVWYRPEYTEIEPWNNFADEYSTGYKTSNFWCDVLYYKANIDNSSSIKQAENYKHAQILANRGKVVIASWKNPEKGQDSSPHFATVLPGNNVDSLYKLKVANVGWENGEKVLEKAFHDKETCDAVHFYYNDNQDYYCNPNVGEDMWFTSINKLEELYNK